MMAHLGDGRVEQCSRMAVREIGDRSRWGWKSVVRLRAPGLFRPKVVGVGALLMPVRRQAFARSYPKVPTQTKRC